jgi:hypothetical protein
LRLDLKPVKSEEAFKPLSPIQGRCQKEAFFRACSGSHPKMFEGKGLIIRHKMGLPHRFSPIFSIVGTRHLDLRSHAMPTFAEYLEKSLKQSTAPGLTNPLVKTPVSVCCDA